MNFAVCWISCSPKRNVFSTSGGKEFFLVSSDFESSSEVGGGRRGINAGTGTGGGVGEGSARERRKLWSPYCFLTALNSAPALRKS